MATNEGADDLTSGSHGSLGGARSTETTNTAGCHRAPWHRTCAVRSLARRNLFVFFSVLVLLTGHSSQTPAQTDLLPTSPDFIRELSLRPLAPDLSAWTLVIISDDPSDYEVYHELFPDSPLAPMARVMAVYHERARLGASPADRLHLERLRAKSLALVEAIRRQERTDSSQRPQGQNHAGPATLETSLGRLQPVTLDPIVEAAREAKGTEESAELGTAPAIDRRPASPGAGLVDSLWQALERAKSKTGMLLLHLLGLAFGLGAATVLDLLIAKSLYCGRLTEEEYKFIGFASKIVCFGLSLLWISGTLFLLHYYHANPAGLENPKVWAKILIVVILTLNGFYIHKEVLPELKRNAGFSVFHQTPKFKRSMMLVSGAVSLVSWYAPLVLGAASELNFAVSAQALLMAYCLALSLGILGAHLLFSLLTARPGDRKQGAERPIEGILARQSHCVDAPSLRGLRKANEPLEGMISDSAVEPALGIRLPSRMAS